MPSEEDTLTVKCPYCDERFVVVHEENSSEQTQNQQQTESKDEAMNAELLSYEEIEGGQPYSGRDENIPVKTCVQAQIKIGGKPHRFRFWYTPEHDGYRYVVRGELESGSKMKTVYESSDYVFYTDRGVPRNSDKKWTYLDKEECRRRARIAGLGEVQSTQTSGRYHIPINEMEEGVVDNEELLLKLAKGLAVFQTTDY